MAKSVSKKISSKASAAKPSGKPPPGDKSFGLDPDIRFYDIEDKDETEKEEESEILVVYESSLAASKQNLVKRQFPYIYAFDHEGAKTSPRSILRTHVLPCRGMVPTQVQNNGDAT